MSLWTITFQVSDPPEFPHPGRLESLTIEAADLNAAVDLFPSVALEAYPGGLFTVVNITPAG
jgi:hypothetical protein